MSCYHSPAVSLFFIALSLLVMFVCSVSFYWYNSGYAILIFMIIHELKEAWYLECQCQDIDLEDYS
jgi:hypothetical protein